jgi:hypothetical protein
MSTFDIIYDTCTRTSPSSLSREFPVVGRRLLLQLQFPACSISQQQQFYLRLGPSEGEWANAGSQVLFQLQKMGQTQ